MTHCWRSCWLILEAGKSWKSIWLQNQTGRLIDFYSPLLALFLVLFIWRVKAVEARIVHPLGSDDAKARSCCCCRCCSSEQSNFLFHLVQYHWALLLLPVLLLHNRSHFSFFALLVVCCFILTQLLETSRSDSWACNNSTIYSAVRRFDIKMRLELNLTVSLFTTIRWVV